MKGKIVNVVSLSGGKDSPEKWAWIEGFEGLYQVSDHGQVKSVDRSVPHGNKGFLRQLKGRPLRLTKKPSGYVGVTLCRNGKPKTRDVHVLVAKAFVPGYKSGREVNHRDGNKSHNLAGNLEWTTRGGNNCHRYRELRHPPVRSWAGKSGRSHNRSMPVVGAPLGGGKDIRFGSTREADRNGFTQSAVARCCRGEQNHHKGYRWHYE